MHKKTKYNKKQRRTLRKNKRRQKSMKKNMKGGLFDANIIESIKTQFYKEIEAAPYYLSTKLKEYSNQPGILNINNYSDKCIIEIYKYVYLNNSNEDSLIKQFFIYYNYEKINEIKNELKEFMNKIQNKINEVISTVSTNTTTNIPDDYKNFFNDLQNYMKENATSAVRYAANSASNLFQNLHSTTSAINMFRGTKFGGGGELNDDIKDTLYLQYLNEIFVYGENKDSDVTNVEIKQTRFTNITNLFSKNKTQKIGMKQTRINAINNYFSTKYQQQLNEDLKNKAIELFLNDCKNIKNKDDKVFECLLRPDNHYNMLIFINNQPQNVSQVVQSGGVGDMPQLMLFRCFFVVMIQLTNLLGTSGIITLLTTCVSLIDKDMTTKFSI
jgi:hypothetical protein